MVAGSGVDYRGGSGEQRRLTAIGSKTPTAKAIIIVPPTPLLLLLAGSGRWATAAAARERRRADLMFHPAAARKH
jgi:hypothetical protein